MVMGRVREGVVAVKRCKFLLEVVDYPLGVLHDLLVRKTDNRDALGLEEMGAALVVLVRLEALVGDSVEFDGYVKLGNVEV
jgi:hypothetical protein